MQIAFHRSTWGMPEDQPLDDKCRQIKEAGFDGLAINLHTAEPLAIRDACQKHGLSCVVMIFPMEPAYLKEWLPKAKQTGAVKCIAHSGRDKWSHADGEKYWREVLAIEKDHGLPIAHETHRHRMFYTPWDTRYYLEKFPDLKVAMDLSHWCCVCESMLDDVPECVEIAVQRAIHVHARVGHEEGPQVSDPSAPQWSHQLERHGGWWDRVRAARQKDGSRELTITPEFGPPNYMQTLPHTGMPVADLDRVNGWMRDWLRSRWKLA